MLSVGCNYLSLPLSPASGTTLLICKMYFCNLKGWPMLHFCHSCVAVNSATFDLGFPAPVHDMEKCIMERTRAQFNINWLYSCEIESGNWLVSVAMICASEAEMCCVPLHPLHWYAGHPLLAGVSKTQISTLFVQGPSYLGLTRSIS